MNTFQENVKSLNKEQLEAVESIEGPVMVIAGPGTGKTHTLTMRIANILERTDVHPSNILALTFTQNAASNMRDKLLKLIGKAAYKVKIMTFHAFCNEILQEYPDKFSFSDSSAQLSDLDRIRIIEDILTSLELEQLTSFNNKLIYKNEIIKLISEMKREGISPKELEEYIEKDKQALESTKKINPRTNKPYGKWTKLDKSIKKNIELARIYREYQKQLQEGEMYDYEDMILLVREKLETDEELLAELQEQFLYVLVDEFQDTNGAQSRVLELLGSFDDQPNIFVVGDDDQSIFRFQGASTENMYDFIKKFPKTKIITLKTSYRCPQTIFDGARSLISQNKNSLEKAIPGIQKNIDSIHKQESKIKLYELETEEDEEISILKKVKELLQKKVPAKEIAIIYRNHKDIEGLAELFAKAEVPASIKADRNLLEQGYINKFNKLLAVVADPIKQSEDIFEVLNYDFLKLPRLQVYKLSVDSYRKRKNFFEMYVDGKIEDDSIKQFFAQILKWQSDDKNMHFVQLAEEILEESELFNFLKEAHDSSAIESIRQLLHFMRGLAHRNFDYKLKNYINDLEKIFSDRLEITLDYDDQNGDAVNMLSAHKAKGLEFDYVLVPKMRDGIWANQKRISKLKLPQSALDSINIEELDKNEEERRLLYVALTRTKQEVSLFYSKKSIEEGKERTFNLSQFATEIVEKYKQTQELKPDEAEKEVYIQRPAPIDFTKREKIFLAGLLTDFKLSATALNNYLEDPEKFLYENLLHIPRVNTKPLIVGNVVHYIFDRINKDSINGTEKEIQNYFGLINSKLRNEYLTQEEAEEIEDEIRRLLTEYFDHISHASHGEKNKVMASEFNFSNRNIVFEDIALSGKIDLIEQIKQTDTPSIKPYARIIDYKTGSPKTRNQILGQTKNSDLKLIRQLQFYKLLTELDDRFPFVPKEYELRFIKAKSNGKFTTETFSSDEINTEEIKQTIREVMKKIKNLEFSLNSEK